MNGCRNRVGFSELVICAGALFRGLTSALRSKKGVAYALLASVTLSCAANVLYAGSDADIITVGVGVFRGHATMAELPVYPPSAIASGHVGVAVVELQVSEAGKVTRVQVLEAPDQAISSAVDAAVKRWIFQPFVATQGKKAFAARGRLIFYFRVAEGKPLVVDAGAEAVARHRK